MIQQVNDGFGEKVVFLASSLAFGQEVFYKMYRFSSVYIPVWLWQLGIPIALGHKINFEHVLDSVVYKHSFWG